MDAVEPVAGTWWEKPGAQAVVDHVYSEKGERRVSYRQYGGSTGRRSGTTWSLPLPIFLSTWTPRP